MKKVIVYLLILFITIGCKKENKPIEVVYDNNPYNSIYRIYTTSDGRLVFTENKIKVYYYENDNRILLDDYITNTWQTVDDSIKNITDLLTNESTYKDGGTKIYRSKDYNITVITCNRINYKKDIYIGDFNMKFDNNNMCAREELNNQNDENINH